MCNKGFKRGCIKSWKIFLLGSYLFLVNVMVNLFFFYNMIKFILSLIGFLNVNGCFEMIYCKYFLLKVNIFV